MRFSDDGNKGANGTQPKNRTQDELAERAADQWAARIRLWAKKHFGELPRSRSTISDDPRR
jgi:hypothetical protein